MFSEHRIGRYKECDVMLDLRMITKNETCLIGIDGGCDETLDVVGRCQRSHVPALGTEMIRRYSAAGGCSLARISNC